jgi:hypothetical protein
MSADQQAHVQTGSEALQNMSERATAQAEHNFEKIVSGEMARQMRNICLTSFKGAQEYTGKLQECTLDNINASFEHMRKLANVKSSTEFTLLSGEYLRLQFETFSHQAQMLAGIGQKITASMTEIAKSHG